VWNDDASSLPSSINGKGLYFHNSFDGYERGDIIITVASVYLTDTIKVHEGISESGRIRLYDLH